MVIGDKSKYEFGNVVEIIFSVYHKLKSLEIERCEFLFSYF